MQLTEHAIQSAFIKWVRIAQKVNPVLNLLFSVPNAAKRSFKLAAMLKAEGMVSGVPDVMFPVSRHGFNGLAIEFKRPGEKPTESQHAFMNALEEEKWFCVVCSDAEAAIKTVRNYLQI